MVTAKEAEEVRKLAKEAKSGQDSVAFQKIFDRNLEDPS